MNKQDSNGARNAQDLERKYNFAELLGLKKNVETQLRSLNKIQNELNEFITAVTKDIGNLQDQVDKNITTFFYEGTPTLENLPVSEWEEDSYIQHLGDLYYDTSTGKAFRFGLENEEYKWILITDTDVTKALALANAAQDTADSKRRIFVDDPIPPYDNGDLWIEEGEVLICQIAKEKNQSFDRNDFIDSLKYTDNTVANAIIDELGGIKTTVLKGQVVIITDGFAKYEDLSDPNSSTTIAGEHITTGKITSNNYLKDEEGTQINLLDGTLDSKNFKIDKFGNIKLFNGAKVVGDNGLMTSYLSAKEGFIGYMQNYSTAFNKQNIFFNILIPEGFEITRSKIVAYHSPVKWGVYDPNTDLSVDYWGYSRGIKLYKSTNINDKLYSAQFGSEFKYADNSGYSEINNAFGRNGWTADVPNDTSHNVQKFESTDFKNIFKKDGKTVSGIYQIKMETAENSDASWKEAEMAIRTGYIVSAMLVLEGYMTYEMQILATGKLITENDDYIVTENDDNIISEGGL